MNVETYLEDLERRIEPEVEERLYREWKEFTDGGFRGDIFSPRRLRASAPGVEWPRATVNAAFADLDMMVLQQYGQCSAFLAEGNGKLLDVRANYGTSISPSLFGVEMFLMEEELDTLPTSWPVEGGADAIRRIVDAGVPDVRKALGAKALAAGERFAEIRAKYPNIGRWVYIYHPDLQGPMDVLEVVWGSAMYLDIVDRPELVKSFLEILTETYIRLMRAWDEVVGGALPTEDAKHYAVHWEMLYRGHIMLRDDTAMNLSPAMYEEFVRPYEERLLAELGGGGVHFCGRGDHFIEALSTLPGLTNVPMSQPEYNDIERILRSTVDKGIKLLAHQRWSAEKAIAEGRDLRGNVHCW